MQVSRMFLWAGACTTALHVGLLLVSYRVRHAVPPQWRTLIDVKEEQSLQAFATAAPHARAGGCCCLPPSSTWRRTTPA
jgi:hypothetical protein